METDRLSLSNSAAVGGSISAASMESLLTVPALKEWAVAVDALIQGNTVLLLRKGGIREQRGTFSVDHSQVLLYPTYEHQQPALLKPAYAQHVQPIASGWHPPSVLLRAWAEITHVFQITQADALSALLPLHIWNQQFVTERLRWKPRQPLYGLALRVHLLSSPQEIVYRAEYGGCKSWIGVSLGKSEGESGFCFEPAPVLTDLEYGYRVTQIQQAVDAQEHSHQSL